MNSTKPRKEFTNEQAKQLIDKQLKLGKSITEIRNKLVEKGWTARRAYKNIKKVREQIVPEETLVIEQKQSVMVANTGSLIEESGFIEKKNYIFNPETQTYIIKSKFAPNGIFTIKAERLRGLRFDYTEGKRSIAELSTAYETPENVITDILNKFGITHTSLPVSEEDLETKSTDELIEDTLKSKSLVYQTELNTTIWKEQQVKAKKWDEFRFKVLSPFETMLKTWNPPKYQPVKQMLRKPTKNGRRFVVGAFDWHIGALVEKIYLNRGKNWNMKIAREAIRNYAKSIAERVMNDAAGFEKCILLFGGDLFQSITGKTANETNVPVEVKGDTQFITTMDIMIDFINSLKEIFDEIDIHYVRGNHGGYFDIPLGMCVKNYFRSEEKINFKVYHSRVAVWREGNIAMILEHGASDHTKAKMPTAEKPKIAYVGNILLSHKDELKGVKQCLCFTGDLHHFTHEEYAEFEHLQSGGLPFGDQYADAHGLGNRPRQNCYIVNNDALEATFHIYFD